MQGNNFKVPNLGSQVPSKQEFIDLQALSQCLQTFNSLVQSGTIPHGMVVPTAKELIPELKNYYKVLLAEVIK